jgi:23S rRNA (guanosine2251-2'-O)-methyltransferase
MPYHARMNLRLLHGFHAVAVRAKTAPETVVEVLVDPDRRDGRMRGFVARLREAGLRVEPCADDALTRLCGGARHQGVAARVKPLPARHSLDDILDDASAAGQAAPLVLALDGVTDPHNLGACLRTADATGVTAVVAPRDHAVGVNATVSKVASGAAETVPYLMVTNLSRSLLELKERDILVIGLSDDASDSLYDVPLTGGVALVMGAEGRGMRQLTRNTCDRLVHLPMLGAVESLNVSVAAAVCLYEVVRQRRTTDSSQAA